jgi:hypothetical protein
VPTTKINKPRPDQVVQGHGGHDHLQRKGHLEAP